MKTNGPYISVKVVNKHGDEVGSMGSRKKRRILHFIQKDKFFNCLFELGVSYENGFTNQTPLLPMKDFLYALGCFLEK